MVVQTNGEIKIANSCDEERPLVKDCSNVEMEKPMYRDPLVKIRVLNIPPNGEQDDKIHVRECVSYLIFFYSLKIRVRKDENHKRST